MIYFVRKILSNSPTKIGKVVNIDISKLVYFNISKMLQNRFLPYHTLLPTKGPSIVEVFREDRIKLVCLFSLPCMKYLVNL
ncbi:MAG: hypothetical protein CM15mP44_2930 [Candidatus Neomarinimicrobiota bacterium]|nr:MAG: hypothetical protein CM15mP44_2930 [Candidatus Neomarinimicrobiota bacterium]